MELNRNSNYNSWYLFFNNKLPNNFCNYFWGSIKALLGSLFLLVVILLLVMILLSPIVLLWSNFDFNTTIGTFQFLGIAFWTLGIIGFIIYKILDYYDNKPFVYKKDSVVKTWYKDFKNKHCTMITWKD